MNALAALQTISVNYGGLSFALSVAQAQLANGDPSVTQGMIDTLSTILSNENNIFNQAEALRKSLVAQFGG